MQILADLQVQKRAKAESDVLGSVRTYYNGYLFGGEAIYNPWSILNEKILAQALEQIRARGYSAELAATGVAPVHAFAVAFNGKRVWVRSGNALTSKKSKPRAPRKKIKR